MRQVSNQLDSVANNFKANDLVANDSAAHRGAEVESGQSQELYFNSPLSSIDPILLTSSIPNEFESFVRALPSELQLRRGGFVIAHQVTLAEDSTLSLIAISDSDRVCAGLGIAIPFENSAVHEVSDFHCLKTVTPAAELKGNFVERHGLVVVADGCLGMYPIAIEGRKVGVVTLNFGANLACKTAAGEITTELNKLIESIARIVPRPNMGLTTTREIEPATTTY